MTETAKLVGRDDLIKEIWLEIANHSILLIDAPRRMGKTSVMKEMAEHPPESTIAFWLDLEDVKSANEFYARLYSRTKLLIGRTARALTFTKRLMGGLSEFQIGSLKIPAIEPFGWKSLIDSLFSSLKAKARKKIVLFLDELPLMLHGIASQRSASEADDVLNLLRRVSDEADGVLTLVFAGSLGMHHVLRLIRKGAKTNSPMINTSHVFPIPPLAAGSGAALVEEILKQSVVRYDMDVPAMISEITCGIPFYTRTMALALKPKSAKWTSTEVSELLDSLLSSQGDLLHIDNDHFGRLANVDYYEEVYRDYVYSLLNLIAANADVGTSRPDVSALSKEAGISILESDNLLKRLGSDHLIDVSKADGRIRFRYEIVRRCWAAHHTPPEP